MDKFASEQQAFLRVNEALETIIRESVPNMDVRSIQISRNQQGYIRVTGRISKILIPTPRE